MRGALTSLLILWLPAVAAADSAKADSLDAAGKAAFQKGEYADAVVAFLAAFEEDPRPAFLFNMAKAQQKLGDFAGAIATLDRYLDEAPKASDREEIEAFQTFLLGKLEATKVRLTIRTNPGGALLRLMNDEGAADHTSPWTGWVLPGRYRLSVSKAGHEDVAHEFVAELGAERNLEIRLTPTAAPVRSGSRVPPPPDQATPAPQASGTNPWPYVALGVAVLAGAGAAWAGLSSRGAVEDAARTRDQAAYREAMDRADQSATLATALGGAAAVGLIAAGALWYVEF